MAHPSGYPLYVLWLRASAWLPAASAAHAAALATAMIAAAQIVVLGAACRAWGAGAIAAAVATAVYAGGPIALELSSQAEVFALNGLFAATILWLVAPASPVRADRRVVLLGLVGGLALSNHLTSVLLLPVGAFGLAHALREVAPGRRLRASGLGVAAFVLGLAPYVYLAVAPRDGISWGAIRGLGDVASHALRSEYGTTTLAPRGAVAAPWPHVSALALALGRSSGWAGAAIGAVALAAMLLRSHARAAWGALFATLLLAGPGLVSLFNVSAHGMGAWVARRFFLLPCLILTIPVAVGLSRLAARCNGQSRLRRLLPALPVGVLLVASAASLDSVARAHSPAVDRFVDNLLRIAPERAVLLMGGDDVTFGLAHAQIVLRRRPDVTHVAWDLMALPWYQERAARRLGFASVPPGDGPPSVRLAEAILASGRPLLVDPDRSRILSALPSHPFGPAIRVWPRGTPLPSPDALIVENRALFARFDLSYSWPERSDGWAAVVHERYAMPWRSLADALGRAGRASQAAEAAALAARLAPR